MMTELAKFRYYDTILNELVVEDVYRYISNPPDGDNVYPGSATIVEILSGLQSVDQFNRLKISPEHQSDDITEYWRSIKIRSDIFTYYDPWDSNTDEYQLPRILSGTYWIPNQSGTIPDKSIDDPIDYVEINIVDTNNNILQRRVKSPISKCINSYSINPIDVLELVEGTKLQFKLVINSELTTPIYALGMIHCGI